MIFGFFKKKPPKAVTRKCRKSVADKEEIGRITHYFSHSKAGVAKLKGPLSVGDKVHIIGHTTDFKQKVSSIQINGKAVASAKKNEEVGLLVKAKVRHSDIIYRV